MLSMKKNMRPPIFLSPPRLGGRRGGFTFTEIMVALAVLLILGSGTIAGLLAAQRYAASSRVLTNARVIVKRNIDTALGVKFSSVDTPPILALTGSNGDAYNGEGNGSPATIPILVNSGSTTLVSGTLTRTVTELSNPQDLVIRRVTFRIDYRFDGRDQSYSMTTLRSQDDQ